MGPLNPSDAEAYRRAHERWKAKAERPYANEIGRLLGAYAREAASAVENGLDPFAGPVADSHAQDVRRVLERRNAMIARQWSGLVRRDAKSAWSHETKGFEEDFEMWLARFLATYTARKVVGIAQTTRDEIRRSIAQGQRDELGPAQIARLIRERTRVIGSARAMTIARTETGQMSNAATSNAADALGIEYRREWSAANSERTRMSHRIAGGLEGGEPQVKAPGEAFQVGDASLMYPGDPDGPPGEVINCRCAIALRTE